MSKPLHQRRPRGNGRGTSVVDKERSADATQRARQDDLLARMRERIVGTTHPGGSSQAT
ncbi:hypothetical protein [Streptomyces angustmyceticus]|uniref:hypothetical protein n=1 Tax=Streptomyces angustmyceticus TaxID=285578 RepID=UPI0021AF2D05|nr:hypothetical protein [Streptomyces angustmyceticus]